MQLHPTTQMALTQCDLIEIAFDEMDGILGETPEIIRRRFHDRTMRVLQSTKELREAILADLKAENMRLAS